MRAVQSLSGGLESGTQSASVGNGELFRGNAWAAKNRRLSRGYYFLPIGVSGTGKYETEYPVNFPVPSQSQTFRKARIGFLQKTLAAGQAYGALAKGGLKERFGGRKRAQHFAVSVGAYFQRPPFLSSSALQTAVPLDPCGFRKHMLRNRDVRPPILPFLTALRRTGTAAAGFFPLYWKICGAAV